MASHFLNPRTQYFQVLDAGDDVLDDLVSMIRKDPRHAGMEIPCDNTINKRCFANWTVGYHIVKEPERDEFDGWLKYGDDFAHSVISYMQLMAKRSKVASGMG